MTANGLFVLDGDSYLGTSTAAGNVLFRGYAGATCFIRSNLVTYSVTATNGVLGAFGGYNLAYQTGAAGGGITNNITLTGPTNTQVVAWTGSNSLSGGAIVLTNGGFRNSVAGTFMVTFGSGFVLDNSGFASFSLRTNGVECGIVRLGNTFAVTTTGTETGFKEAAITLPANTLTELWATNSARILLLNNTCFNMKGAN